MESTTRYTLQCGLVGSFTSPGIGLYRYVWIAAIASSRTSLATLTGAMCKTSQCELRSLRVNSGMLNVELDCNGDFAIKAYRHQIEGTDGF